MIHLERVLNTTHNFPSNVGNIFVIALAAPVVVGTID
jgi:hypothetical protein